MIDPNETSGENLPSQTRVELTYENVSKVTADAAGAHVELATETHRSSVRFAGKIKEPIKLREALSALYMIVSSDYRYKPKDKTAYANYLRMKRETSHLNVWQAQQAYFSWLHRNDPLTAMILDPVISVHPDRLNFEIFSKDESTYANLSIDPSQFESSGETEYGTTYIDFSQPLFDGVQQMRSYRETQLHIGTKSVQVATTGTTPVVEKKIQVADSWLRGFLQVQSAATLPLDRFEMAPIDLYNVLRSLRMQADQKGKRRGLRVELIPGQKPRLVLEPWEKVIPCTGAIYKGSAARVVRIWGRRRLMMIRRLLPYLTQVEVGVMGTGLPSFWILRGSGFTLTVGLTGFTNANWSQAVSFDLLLPRKTQTTKSIEKVQKYLADDVWFATSETIGKETGLKGPALLETLQMGCQQGLWMFDLAQQVYRLRPLTDQPLDMERLQYRNHREKTAYDLFQRKEAVKILSENRIPNAGLELTGEVTVTEDRRDYRPVLLLSEEGGVSKAECTCSFFRKQGLKAGPCAHLIALRLAYAKQEADKAQGVEARQLITVETKSFSRRDTKGEEVYLVSLERRLLKIRWGRTGQPMRQQTLRFNSQDHARQAYFDRISTLDEKGFLNVTDS